MRKMLDEIKKHITSLKVGFWVFICLVGMINFIYYGFEYFFGGSLSFSKEDWFIFTLGFVSNLVIYGLLVFLFIERRKIKTALKEIYEAIAESEDNIIKVQRNTQELLIRLFEKRGDRKNEEKSSIKQEH